jgi:hypothetical protein
VQASGGPPVRELLRLLLTELQGFELLALPAGALSWLPTPPRRRALASVDRRALPLAGARCCGPLEACTGPAIQRQRRPGGA